MKLFEGSVYEKAEKISHANAPFKGRKNTNQRIKASQLYSDLLTVIKRSKKNWEYTVHTVTSNSSNSGIMNSGKLIIHFIV
jgi:hypothetical protein